jgi:hypothetical protein
MRAFSFSLIARYPDGVTRPLTGEVGAPVPASDGTDDYLCSFVCPLIGGGGQFRSRYPEWAYSRAVSFIRFDMEGRGFEVQDAKGNAAVLVAPVTDEFGIPCFAPARFRGRCLHDDVLTDFTAEVQPPERTAQGDWGCLVELSQYGFRNPILAGSPEHAYELAFAFLRQMTDYRGEGQLTDRKGSPLLIRAPVRPSRRH